MHGSVVLCVFPVILYACASVAQWESGQATMRLLGRPVQKPEQFKDNPAWPFGRMRPVRKKRYPADLPPAPF